MGFFEYPFHAIMLFMNLLASIATILLGAWFIFIYHKATTMEATMEELEIKGIPVDPSSSDVLVLKEEDYVSEKYPVQTLKTAGLILAVLSFIFGIYLLKRACDLTILVFGNTEMACIGGYLEFIARDYRACIMANVVPDRKARGDTEFGALVGDDKKWKRGV